MTGDPVYLDHNATTPLDPAVLDAMLPYLREHHGNPSSDHQTGRRARKAVERAREQVATALDAEPDEVLFTSGGTESDNLAILGTAERATRRALVISAIEHPAVTAPAERLARQGFGLTRLPVDADGRIDPEAVLPDRPALVSVMLANNETGVIQPVARLAERARAAGAVVHTDAAQAIGRLPVSMRALGVDLLTVAGHKLHGPKGVGALLVRRGTPLAPQLHGGGQQHGARPGTENVASIVGLGEACRIAVARLDDDAPRLASLRDLLAARLAGAIPGLRITGLAVDRLPNTLHVRVPGVRGSEVLARCPEVEASTGSACHAGEEHPSGVLSRMGLAPDDALGALRLSLGRGSTEDGIERAARALIAAVAASALT